jgi:hypothetical protein
MLCHDKIEKSKIFVLYDQEIIDTGVISGCYTMVFRRGLNGRVARTLKAYYCGYKVFDT